MAEGRARSPKTARGLRLASRALTPGAAVMVCAALFAACSTNVASHQTKQVARRTSRIEPSATTPTSTTTSEPVTGATAAPNGQAGTPPGHVFVVMMENLSYSSAMSTPGLAALAHRYAWLSDSFAVTHPSLPNYLALTSGHTFGIRSDCLSCYVSADNLAAELDSAGISFGAYFQSVSSPCYLGTSYDHYAAKHNPFRYYTDVRFSARLCSRLLPLSDLYSALAGAAVGVPDFVWVTPNDCYDGHSCPATEAASWLTSLVGRITASAAWKDGGVLFVTWDEGAFGDTRQVTPSGRVLPSGGGGHILTLVISPGIPPGTEITAPLNHYGLLATIEAHFGLPLLGHASAWAGHTLHLPS